MRLAKLCLIALLAACQPSEPRPAAAESGRAETQGLRNVEALGVNGSGIADKVDGALDANDARKGELDKSLEAQESSP